MDHIVEMNEYIFLHYFILIKKKTGFPESRLCHASEGHRDGVSKATLAPERSAGELFPIIEETLTCTCMQVQGSFQSG